MIYCDTWLKCTFFILQEEEKLEDNDLDPSTWEPHNESV